MHEYRCLRNDVDISGLTSQIAPLSRSLVLSAARSAGASNASAVIEKLVLKSRFDNSLPSWSFTLGERVRLLDKPILGSSRS